MKHFFESLEREIDFHNEYCKIEYLMDEKKHYRDKSINVWIEENFRLWEKRRNYTSFEEVRRQLGFVYGKIIDMEDYFLYCEMLYTIFFDFKKYSASSDVWNRIETIKNTMKYNIEISGLELRKTEKECIIVEKNPMAIEVASVVPSISDEIIEYNRYLLRGDIERKREILIKLADALEPKKKDLDRIFKQASSDFFYMANSMNIRHNNCDPYGPNYKKKFAELNPKEKEKWYDEAYNQALLLFALLEYDVRKESIKSYKENNE